MSPLAERVRVDPVDIERRLADLWRREHHGGEAAVTRAALWNVIAHTSTEADHARAGEVLGRVASSIPQRTILIRSEPEADRHLSSWIGAHCEIRGGGSQVCSEQVAIVAGGDSVGRVPPLVHSLLLPDMPVALWWIGPLTDDKRGYLANLLEPADRLIVDSAQFRTPGELDVVRRTGEQSATAPADLNWVRLEEWRLATATLFDPPALRGRLNTIRSVRVALQNRMQSVLYSSWLAAQTGLAFECTLTEGGDQRVEIAFEDGSGVTVVLDDTRHVIHGDWHAETDVDCVTHVTARSVDELLVRQLERRSADPVFIRSLPLAVRMAAS